jgi:hypothetical protein
MINNILMISTLLEEFISEGDDELFEDAISANEDCSKSDSME